MSISKYSIFALLGLLLSSLCLELTPRPHSELVTEAACWVLILLGGKLGFSYSRFASNPRPFNSAELSNLAFGAILLCLSCSFKSTIWTLAPLLCIAIVVIENRTPYLSAYLPINTETKGDQPDGQQATKRTAFIGLFAVVVAGVLIGSDSVRSDYRLKICWLFAQVILYWALTRRFGDSGTKEMEGEHQQLEEALRTATELAPYMVVATVPLSVLWWSGPPVLHTAGLLAIMKASRWISVLVLANESKVSLLPWATVFVVCTKATWEFSLIFQSGLATLGALIALYRTATTFPQSDRRKRIVLAVSIFPLLAFVYRSTYSHSFSTWSSGPSGALKIVKSWDKSSHPIAFLAEEARARFAEKQSQQSTSFPGVVAEYRKRYGRSPPPGFDRWYNWAIENNVQFLDEYDYLTKSFEPFWQLPPKTLREYVDQAVSAKCVNTLEVKDHKAGLRAGSFQHKQLVQLLEPIAHFLPDFKAVLNECDEPRVMPPHDSIFGQGAEYLKASNKESEPVFFASQDQQNCWNSATLSCAPDSTARSALVDPKADNPFPPFISNLTEAQDICTWTASGSHQHGFLSSPSTFDYTQRLVPMISTARLSTFRDIMIPSSYYFQDDIFEHDEQGDSTYEEKKDVVYWRGTGTGGHWHSGSWREGHRQRFVDFTNTPDAKVRLMNQSKGHWTPYQAQMSEVMQKFQVNFTNFIQCDEQDCKDEEEYFHKAERDTEINSHQYKVLYNLDGNSFSGRYYRYLKSNSLVFMQALFKEWHDDRLFPWVHFVPISVSMEELPETARYLLDDPEGKVVAQRIAADSREWTRRILRPVDLTAAYYRAFLEYARLMDDERDALSCC